MVYKFYYNSKTKEKVDVEDAKDYALTKLGLMQDGDLCIKYRGKNGEHTLEQLEMLDTIVEWYFSDWEEVEEYENEEEDYYAVKDDLMYEDYISRKMEEN